MWRNNRNGGDVWQICTTTMRVDRWWKAQGVKNERPVEIDFNSEISR